MSFNNNIPDWAAKQFFPQAPKSAAETRFDEPKKVDDSAEKAEKNRATQYMKQLAHMNPEFRRTVEQKKAPENLIGKPAIMKAHIEGSYDNGAHGSAALKNHPEFSVMSQLNKLKDVPNQSDSVKAALSFVAEKDSADTQSARENRAARELASKRTIEKIVRTEGFVNKAQEQAKSTFEREVEATPDFRSEREAIKSKMGREQKVKDEFKVSVAKPAGSNLVNALRETMKKKGLI